MISKIDSIKVSERIFDLLSDAVDELNEELNSEMHQLEGYLSTFNNCREQGYYLTLFDNKNYVKGDLYIWAYQNRNSDNITITIQENESPTNKGMFSETAYNHRKLFDWNEEHKAVDYIYDRICKFFDLSEL